MHHFSLVLCLEEKITFCALSETNGPKEHSPLDKSTALLPVHAWRHLFCHSQQKRPLRTTPTPFLQIYRVVHQTALRARLPTLANSWQEADYPELKPVCYVGTLFSFFLTKIIACCRYIQTFCYCCLLCVCVCQLMTLSELKALVSSISLSFNHLGQGSWQRNSLKVDKGRWLKAAKWPTPCN